MREKKIESLSELTYEERKKLRERLKEEGKLIPITLYSQEEVRGGISEREGAIGFGESLREEDWHREGGKPIPEEEQKAILEALLKAKEYEPIRLDKVKDVFWIVPGIVLERGTTCCAGESEAGKTTFWLQLSKALLDGGDFFGIPIKEPMERILWFEIDEDLSMLKDQVEKVSSDLLQRLLVFSDLRWDKTNRVITGLDEIVYWNRPQLIIIDAIGSIGLQDEDDNTEISALYKYLRVLMTRYNFSTALLHHLSKAEVAQSGKTIPLKQRVRGAGDIVNRADCVLGMQRSGYKAHLSTIKARTEAKVELNLLQDPHTLVFRKEMARDEYIASLITQGLSKKDIITSTQQMYGGKQDTVRKAVERVAKDLGISL